MLKLKVQILTRMKDIINTSSTKTEGKSLKLTKILLNEFYNTNISVRGALPDTYK